MTDHAPQPTVLVKKADGTSVRMTLDEVKAMKKPEKKHHQPKPKTQPLPHALATTAPVTNVFVDEAAAKRVAQRPAPSAQQPKPWQKSDVSSPLEEKSMSMPATIVEDTPLGPGKEVAEKVLRKAGWDLSEATKARLTPLIVSRVKEVRTDGQFLVHAMTPTHRGGVGLSPAQAEQLLAAIQTFLPQNRESRIQNLESRIPQTPTAKPMMHDITPPQTKAVQMGPKEEFAAFALADFKRLGATTDASLSRLKEKFDTLKAESYILFLDVRDAWFESPLATAYVEKVLTALREKKKLSEVLDPAGSKEGVSQDVVKAIVDVNTYISV